MESTTTNPVVRVVLKDEGLVDGQIVGPVTIFRQDGTTESPVEGWAAQAAAHVIARRHGVELEVS